MLLYSFLRDCQHLSEIFLRQCRTNEAVGRRMDFPSDANAISRVYWRVIKEFARRRWRKRRRPARRRIVRRRLIKIPAKKPRRLLAGNRAERAVKNENKVFAGETFKKAVWGWAKAGGLACIFPPAKRNMLPAVIPASSLLKKFFSTAPFIQFSGCNAMGCEIFFPFWLSRSKRETVGAGKRGPRDVIVGKSFYSSTASNTRT